MNGLTRAMRASPVDSSLILAIDRGQPELDAAQAVALAGPYLGRSIAALGLAGPEIGNPPSKFEHVFVAAKAVGLHRVAHAGGPRVAACSMRRQGPGPPGPASQPQGLRGPPCNPRKTAPFSDAWPCSTLVSPMNAACRRPPSAAGEEGGPAYVREALGLLGVERIDHGIRSIEDPELVAAMVAKGVAITLCPLSNLRLQVYSGQLEAKIREVLSSGLRVTINSDDPAYFGAYVAGNYEWVAGVAGLGPDELAQLAANSFEASFLPKVRARGWKHREGG
jgi:adenosine deaminase